MNVSSINRIKTANSAEKTPSFSAKFGVHRDVVKEFQSKFPEKVAYDKFEKVLTKAGKEIAELEPKDITIIMDLAKKHRANEELTNENLPYVLITYFSHLKGKSEPFYFDTKDLLKSMNIVVSRAKNICNAVNSVRANRTK